MHIPQQSTLSATQWLHRLLIIWGTLLIVAVFVINFAIDPYGEFRLINTPYNALKLTTRNTSAAHLIDSLGKGKHALVFGSSRTYLLSSELLGEPTLNLSSSVYRYPKDIWAFFSLLNEEQRNNISRVYILADDRFFNNDNRYFDFGSSLELQATRFANIDFAKIQDAYKTVAYNLSVLNDPETFTADITDTGTFRQKDVIPAPNLSAILDSPSSEQILYFDKVLAFLKSRNIEYVLFSAPWRLKSISMEPISSASHILQTETLLKHVPKFYDFLKAFDADGDDALYRDATHLNNGGIKKFAELLLHKREEYAVTNNNIQSVYTAALSNADVVNKITLMKHIASGDVLSIASQEDTLNTAIETHIPNTIYRLMHSSNVQVDIPLDTAINIGYREEEFIRPLFLYGIINNQDIFSTKLLKNAFKNNKKLFKEVLTYFHNTGQLQNLPDTQKLETINGFCTIGNLNSDLLFQYGFVPASTNTETHPVMGNTLGADIPSHIYVNFGETPNICKQLGESTFQ